MKMYQLANVVNNKECLLNGRKNRLSIKTRRFNILKLIKKAPCRIVYFSESKQYIKQSIDFKKRS